jgi:hypothetical protein
LQAEIIEAGYAGELLDSGNGFEGSPWRGPRPAVKASIMARRRSSLGLFGVFGRSEDLRTLDSELRSAALHPALVPEAVKLTVLTLLKDTRGEDPSTQDYRETAALLAYCALGREVFDGENGALAAAAAEQRIETALEAGEGFDASLILLALHAEIIHPGVKDRFQLESV